MSVDLTGSTAYKARHEDRDPSLHSPNPAWVDRMRRFYRGFPSQLATEFAKEWKGNGEPHAADAPAVWKTVGDEIIFCARLHTVEHMAACVKAFINALKSYGAILEAEKAQLDVKGYAWIASFPYPNVTLSENTIDHHLHELPDEDTEIDADKRPSDFDFLGKHIDCGFRISKFSSSSNFVLSIEVFYLLVHGAKFGAFDPLNFRYEGRHYLKGVLGDTPYPIFALDTERSVEKISLRSREEKLLPERRKFDTNEAWDFATEFMNLAKIEVPVLPKKNESLPPPHAYAEYVQSWQANQNEIRHQDKLASDAEKSESESEAKQGADSEMDRLQQEIDAVLRDIK